MFFSQICWLHFYGHAKISQETLYHSTFPCSLAKNICTSICLCQISWLTALIVWFSYAAWVRYAFPWVFSLLPSPSPLPFLTLTDPLVHMYPSWKGAIVILCLIHFVFHLDYEKPRFSFAAAMQFKMWLYGFEYSMSASYMQQPHTYSPLWYVTKQKNILCCTKPWREELSLLHFYQR